jgi:acyl dehydratase
VTERMEQLYLEDLAIGQRFTSEAYVMEAARIMEFAAEFDPQPFHIDDSAAEGSVFKGLAASGWHTAAVAITPSRSKPHQGIVTVRSTMFNQHGEEVYVSTAKLLVLRRPK